MQREGDARRGRDAFAAGPMMVDRIEVTEEYRDGGRSSDPVRHIENLRERARRQYHDESFDTVADQREHGSGLVAGPKDIRRAGVP